MREGGQFERSDLTLCLDLAIVGNLIQEIGVFGQGFFPSNCRLVMSWAVSFTCLAVLVACAGDPGERLQSGRIFSWVGPEGRWVGAVVPMDSDCGVSTTGLMTIGNSTFAFDPFQSTAVLQGKLDPDGNIMGEADRPVPGNRSVTMRFLGRIQHSEGSEGIVGTLTSGRCHWSVTLFRG
jgi:hypothetical protein